jgi:hypothetical protein
MHLLFITIISFLCSFVAAQEVNNDELLFSNFIDNLINFGVLIAICIILNYDTEEASPTSACLIRSLMLLFTIGLQEEIAFITTSVNVPNYIKNLQHIVIGLIGCGVIGNFVTFNYDNVPISKFEKLEKWVNTEFVRLENKLKRRINYELDNLEEEMNNKFDNLEKGINSKLEDLGKKINNKLLDIEYEVNSKLNIFKVGINNLENRVQKLEQKMEISNETQPLKCETIQIQQIRGHNNSYIQDRMFCSQQTPYLPLDNKKIDFLSHYNFLLRRIEYVALILFTIILYFLFNELEENITSNFIITLTIPLSLTLTIQITILIISHHRKNLQSYIKWHLKDNLLPKIITYADLTMEIFVLINLLYLPSLINSFLLQTPDIFNKIFLNLSILNVTVWIARTYKEIKYKGEKEREKEKEKDK